MRFVEGLLKLIVILVPLIVLVAMSVNYVIKQADRTLDYARPVVEEQLTLTLGRRVEIEALKLRPWGTAEASGISIEDVAGPGVDPGQKMISADRLYINYHLPSLIAGMGAQAVKSIKIIRPYIHLVRRPSGTLNIMDLVQPPTGKPGPAFMGKIEVLDAAVDYDDFKGFAKTRRFSTRLSAMNVFVDARTAGKYRLVMDTKGTVNTFSKLKVSAVYDQYNESASANGYIQDISLSEVLITSGYSQQVALSAGTMDARAALQFSLANNTVGLRDFDGSADFKNISGYLPAYSVPIDRLSGRAVVTNEQAVVSLAGTILGSTGTIAGTVTGTSNPWLDLSVDFTSVDSAAILAKLPASKAMDNISAQGTGRLAARVIGNAADPYIETAFSVPQIEYGQYVVKNIRMHGLYSEGTVDVDGITLVYEGARIGAAGNITGFNQPVPEVNFKGWVRDLNLASLPFIQENPVSGLAGVDITASGSLKAPRVDAVAWVDNPSGKRGKVTLGAERIYAKLSWVDETLLIKDLIASGASGGTIALRGQASEQNLDIAISARQINTAKAAAWLGIGDVSGYVFFDGKVSGTPSKPWIDGLLEAFSPRYQEYRADYVKGAVSGNLEKLTVEDGVVLRSPTDIGFTAQLHDITSSEVPFNVDALVHRLDIQNTLAMVDKQADVSGTVSGDLWGSGIFLKNPPPESLPFKNAKGSLLANIQSGTAYGYPLDATLSLNYENDRLGIVKAIAKSDKTELVAGGTLTPSNKDVNVDFEVHDVELAELRNRLGDSFYVTGVGGVTGTITGKLTDPIVRASGSIDNLVVNGLVFDSTTLDAAYASGIVRDAAVELKRGEQLIRASADRVDFRNRYVADLSATLRSVSATDLWSAMLSTPSETGASIREAVQGLPRITSGTLNGDVKLSGDMDKLDGSAEFNFDNIGLDQSSIDSVDIAATVDKGVVDLDNMLAKIGDGTLQAVGSPFYSSGNTSTSLSIRNLDMQSLRPFLGSSTPTGTMEAEFMAEGQISKPFVRGSLELVRPSFQSVEFDGIRVGDVRISLDKSELDPNYRQALGDYQAIVLADDAVVSLADHQLNVGGFVPWNWSTFQIPKDVPLNVAARINNQDMATLASLSPIFDTESTSGILHGEVQLTGTLNDHRFEGGIALKDGRAALKKFKNKFNDVDIDLAFYEGDKLKVNQFDISSDMGGKLYVKPGSYVQIGGVDGNRVDMQVVADAFKVGEKNFFGLTEDIDITLNAGIGIDGPLETPTVHDQDVDNVKGGIKLYDSKMVFAIPETKGKAAVKPFAYNPKFDLSMSLGDNVLVQPPALKITPTGGGTLKGSLNNPDLTLNLGVKQGYMVIAARRMRVAPGGSLKVKYNPPADLSQRINYSPEVDVDFHASTTLTADNAFGKTERYVVTISATGDLAKMNIDLKSDPEGLSKEQILAELGHVGALGSGGVELEKELSNIISAVGSSTLFSPIETMFVEQLGFEQFTLDYSRSAQPSLYFSRSLSSNFYVSYFQTLRAGVSNKDSKQFEIKLGYRPKGPYQITVGVDDQQVYTIELSVSKLFN